MDKRRDIDENTKKRDVSAVKGPSGEQLPEMQLRYA